MDKRIRAFRFRKSSAIYFLLLLISLTVLLHTYSSEKFPSFSYFSDFKTELKTYESIETILRKENIITDIKIKRCLKYSSCELSKVEKVQEWRKLDYPLELYAGSSYLKNFGRSIKIFNNYICVKENSISKADRGLVDVRITASGSSVPEGEDSNDWTQEPFDTLTVWKKFANVIGKDANFAKVEFIRELDVFFGLDDLVDGRENWHLQEEPIPIQSYENIIPPHLSLLRVSLSRQKELIQEYVRFNFLKTNLIMNTESSYYKVLQISDLHFGPDKGKCEGGDQLVENCDADAQTLEFIESSIEKEKNRPIDLIVITGDLIDSFRTKDFRSTILKSLSPILEKKIPFIFTFGESDEVTSAEEAESNAISTDEDRKIDPHLKLNILNFISSLPYSYNSFQQYSNDIHGISNYNIKVYRYKRNSSPPDPSRPDAIISVLDSENHKIHSSQINHLYRFNQGLKTENPFKLIFFHYPLPNFRPQGEFPIVGSYNTKDPLNVKTDTKFRDDLFSLGYQVVSVGHEHENDACILSEKVPKSPDNIWLCYNSVTGQSADTNIENFDRKLRLFEINFEEMEVLTWKRRKSDGEPFDYQRIYTYKQEVVE